MSKKIVNELIEEQIATIDMIYELKKLVAKEEMKKDELEYYLWSTTDFAKLKLGNAEQRKSFVKDQLKDINHEISTIKSDLLYAENQLKILKTKEKFLLEFGLDIFDEKE